MVVFLVTGKSSCFLKTDPMGPTGYSLIYVLGLHCGISFQWSSEKSLLKAFFFSDRHCNGQIIRFLCGDLGWRSNTISNLEPLYAVAAVSFAFSQNVRDGLYDPLVHVRVGVSGQLVEYEPVSDVAPKNTIYKYSSRQKYVKMAHLSSMSSIISRSCSFHIRVLCL